MSKKIFYSNFLKKEGKFLKFTSVILFFLYYQGENCKAMEEKESENSSRHAYASVPPTGQIQVPSKLKEKVDITETQQALTQIFKYLKYCKIPDFKEQIDKREKNQGRKPEDYQMKLLETAWGLQTTVTGYLKNLRLMIEDLQEIVSHFEGHTEDLQNRIHALTVENEEFKKKIKELRTCSPEQNRKIEQRPLQTNAQSSEQLFVQGTPNFILNKLKSCFYSISLEKDYQQPDIWHWVLEPLSWSL